MPNQIPTQDPQNTSSPNDSQSVKSPVVQESVVLPSFSPQSDLPPMPPDFQNIPEEKENKSVVPVSTEPQAITVNNSATPDTPIEDSGSAAPTDIDISSVIKSPNKKFGTKKIIATILGLFLLIGGVGTGVILTQQQQNIKQKAAEYNDCTTVHGSDDWTTPNTHDIVNCGSAVTNTNGVFGCKPGYYVCQIDPPAQYLPICCKVGVNTLPTAPPPPANPTPTATATPTAPYCVAVKAYSSDWTALTSTDLSALTAGTVINFCVSGSAPSGTFDMAQFTINGTQLTTTTTHRPSSTDFCQNYTILSTDTTVNVSARIHHSTLGWY